MRPNLRTRWGRWRNRKLIAQLKLMQAAAEQAGLAWPDV